MLQYLTNLQMQDLPLYNPLAQNHGHLMMGKTAEYGYLPQHPLMAPQEHFSNP